MPIIAPEPSKKLSKLCAFLIVVGLLLAVLDNSRELNDEDFSLLKEAKNVPTIVIINKTDLVGKLDTDKIADYCDNIIKVSAASGEGKEKIISAVRKIAGTDKLNPSEGILSNERQRTAVVNALCSVTEAKESLKNGMTYDAVTVSLEEAISAVLELTGERVSEEIVDRVFHNFCVGK